MAHSTLHFSLGMIVGSLFTLPPLLRAWLKREALARRFARWFMTSYALGVFAVVPGILRRLGLPDAFCDAAAMNVFLLYPWIDAVKPGAQTSGPLALGACLATQYLTLVAALVWTRRRQTQASSFMPQRLNRIET